MNIEESKIELTKMILEIDDSSVVDKFMNFLRSESTLSERQKKAIDASIKQFENGEGIPHDEVMREMRTRYPKHFKL